MAEEPKPQSLGLADYSPEEAAELQAKLQKDLKDRGQTPATIVVNSMSYPWSWDMLYLDPANYKNRNINPGFNSGLTIATGGFPAGYRVANGQPGGGFPTGQSDGTLPIRLCPPNKGTGIMLYRSDFRLRIKNMGTSTGWYTCSLGTTSSSGSPDPGRPCYPYLGVSHDNGAPGLVSIAAGAVQDMVGFRIDIVDANFAPVANWPNWAMDANSTTTKLYPALCPIFRNAGQTILQVFDVFCTSSAC